MIEMKEETQQPMPPSLFEGSRIMGKNKDEDPVEVTEYLIAFTQSEAEFVEQKAQQKHVSKEQYIQASALNNSRRRHKDIEVRNMANEASADFSRLCLRLENTDKETLDLVMKIRGELTGLCLS